MPPHPANYSFERRADSPPHFGNALELASVFHTDAFFKSHESAEVITTYAT